MKYFLGVILISLIASGVYAHSSKVSKSADIVKIQVSDIAANTHNEVEEGFSPVLLMGIFTALSLLLTASFALLRSKIKLWMKYHKVFAYITISLMIIHSSLAIYEHFF